MATTFPASTFKARAYYGINQAAYTNTATSGQRFALYFPIGKPSDYWGSSARKWPGIVGVPVFPGFVSSATFSDGTADDITESQGFWFQCLLLGIPVAIAQVTKPDEASTYTGDGFYHAPGGVDRRWEGGFDGTDQTTYPNGYKDALMFQQHLRYWAASLTDANGYGCLPNICAAGTSGGAIIHAGNMFCPNRANELGQGGQYEVSTVPNCNVVLATAVTWWEAYETTVAAGTIFPSAETGANAEVTAGTLADAPTRYLREASIWTNLPAKSGPVIPHTYWWASEGVNSFFFGEPFQHDDIPTNPSPSTADPSTGGIHSANNGLILKSHFRDRVKMYVYPGIAANSGLAGLLDGSVDALTAGGDPASDNVAVANFIKDHLQDKPWDDDPDKSGIPAIHRRGQVEDIGRCCVPYHAKRKYTIVTNTSDDDGVGAALNDDLLVGTGRLGAIRTLGVGDSVTIPGSAKLWIRAKSTQAKYAVDEVFSD